MTPPYSILDGLFSGTTPAQTPEAAAALRRLKRGCIGVEDFAAGMADTLGDDPPSAVGPCALLSLQGALDAPLLTALKQAAAAGAPAAAHGASADKGQPPIVVQQARAAFSARTMLHGLPLETHVADLKRFGSLWTTARALCVSLVLKPGAKATAEDLAALGAELQVQLAASTAPAPQAHIALAPTGATHLIYTSMTRNTTDALVLVMVYVLIFLYVFFVISRVHAVKSKFGLAFTAVVTSATSLATAVGVCQHFGLISNLPAVEVVPFLIAAIGLDNFATLTRCVVETPPDVAVRFRIAEGVSRAGVPLTMSLLQMEFLLGLGALSQIPVLREFCIIACVAMLSDYCLQVVIYVSVLSLDTRRMELSDLFNRRDVFLGRSSHGSDADGALGDVGGGRVRHGAVGAGGWVGKLVGWASPSLRGGPPLLGAAADAPSHSDSNGQSRTQQPRAVLQTMRSRGTYQVIVINNVLVAMSMVAVLVTYILGLAGPRLHRNEAGPEPTVNADWTVFGAASWSMSQGGDLSTWETRMGASASDRHMGAAGSMTPHVAGALTFFPVLTVQLPDGPAEALFSLEALAGEQWALLRRMAAAAATPWAAGVAGVVVVAAVLLHLLLRLLQKRLFGVRDNADALAALSLMDFTVSTLAGHPTEVDCLTVDAGTRRVASASLDGQVRVWDMATQRLLVQLERHTATADADGAEAGANGDGDGYGESEDDDEGEANGGQSEEEEEEEAEAGAVTAGGDNSTSEDGEGSDVVEAAITAGVREDGLARPVSFSSARSDRGLRHRRGESGAEPQPGASGGPRGRRGQPKTRAAEMGVPWSLALWGDALAIGTGNGSVELWELSTGSRHDLALDEASTLGGACGEGP